MPRTKRVTRRTSKKSVDITESTVNEDIENQSEYVTQAIKAYDKKCKEYLHNLKMRTIAMKHQISLITTESRLRIPHKWGNKTIGELRNCRDSTFLHTLSDTATSTNLFEVKSARQRGHTNKKRSLSVADCEDEGYQTVASEGNSVGGSRKSRTHTRQAKATRISRSVSKSRIPQMYAVGALTTPANPIPARAFETVTPKVKPNTPQVILRRPREGEMAISMQGSPLMVNTIVSKDANVNIPLEDGRTISIQPQLGLRVSELPPMDPGVIRQVKALRDNLIKMCSLK